MESVVPIYEYQCKGCHHQFDLIQKMNDEPIKLCPNCSKNEVVRLVSAAGFQLKGTGWYATDFKTKDNSDKRTTTKVEKSSSNTTDAKASTSSSTKESN